MVRFEREVGSYLFEAWAVRRPLEDGEIEWDVGLVLTKFTPTRTTIGEVGL